jgi:hypothetical protein
MRIHNVKTRTLDQYNRCSGTGQHQYSNSRSSWFASTPGRLSGREARTPREESTMKSVRLSILTAVATLVAAPGLMGQTMFHVAQAPFARVQVPRVQLNLPPELRTSSNVRIADFPNGPSRQPYPLVSAPANDAWAEERVGCLQPKPVAHPWNGRFTRRSEPCPLSGAPDAGKRRVSAE